MNCYTSSFGTEPYLIRVGKNCLFAAEVQFITHDGGVKVLNTLGYFDGKRMDSIAPITIGDNVYIGMGAYIMPGVHIGNNVVIGACAVVTRDIPDNSVAVGIPARVIKTIDEYYADVKRKERFYATAGMSPEQKRAFFSEKTSK